MSAECLIWRVHGGVLTLSVAGTQEVNIIVTVCDTPKHLLDPFRALEIEISIKGDFTESSANSKTGSFLKVQFYIIKEPGFIKIQECYLSF